MQGTKMTAGGPGYVITSNAIALVTVNETQADQKAGDAETSENICSDGNTYPDSAIDLTPQAIASTLVSNYFTTNPTDANNPNPPAPAEIPAANNDGTVGS